MSHLFARAPESALRQAVLDSYEKQAAQVSEIALASTTLRGFDEGLLSSIESVIGYDAACSSWTQPQAELPHMTTLGYPVEPLRRTFGLYMGELTASELAQFALRRPALDLDVINAQRRGSLAVYRELLGLHQVSSFVTNVWHGPSGVYGIHFARTGSSRPFSAQTITRLERLMPVIKLGMALLAAEAPASAGVDQLEGWAREWGLSPRERDTVRLVARGFRNGEIAQMLRISPHTVRNHLVSVFRKAEVSTRSELLFAMQTPSSAGTDRSSRRTGAVRPWSSYLSYGVPDPLQAKLTP